MKVIKGGYQLQILNGVLHLNTVEGCVLRMHGLPKHLTTDTVQQSGDVTTGLIGT